ncbi:hypothetical protein [Blastopirellula marina]|uniref:Methyltransferase domain-containing protein n=1 Tax=Blastopirellula marina TaxID=124 RepID=A0A2S8GL15_9BACT|nr:hypothetical protein [Blastopirellula marina]PQO44704.1 hypothetical protein C5Y93_18240 [Blastopirellula marina]
MNEESLAKLRQRNLDSAGDWKRYASHRRQATRLILEAAPEKATRLCLLGAGNCNDVELTALFKTFGEIHLVDLDKAAMQEGLQRQKSGIQGKAILHGPIDINTDQAASQLAGLGEFDVVASICILSQLIDEIPEDQREKETAVPLAQKIRRRHFDLLAKLAGEKGNIVIANEAVSSDSEPRVATCDPPQLGPLLVELAMQQKLFIGLNPAVLALDLQTLSTDGELLTSPPWKWDFGPRTYAVCGHTLKRQA